MRLGLKNIFRRGKKSKAEKAAETTPKGKGDPRTPETEPVKEDPPERRDDGPPRYSDELPVKNLLKQLDISGVNDSGDTEMILGQMAEVPDDEPPMEHEESENLPPPLTDEDSEDVPPPMADGGTPPKKKRSKTPDAFGPRKEEAQLTPDKMKSSGVDESFEDSPLRPRQLMGAEEDIEDDAGSVTLPATENIHLKVDQDMNLTKKVSETIMGFFEKAKECATGVLGDDPVIKRLIPTADNDMCQRIGNTRSRSDISASVKRPKVERQYSYYNEQFALKILDELINVGYALVNHQQIEDEDEDGDWVGRSVTLILRPGTCNALQVQAPYLEWATLGGGQQSGIETTAVSLLDIHSITTSTLEDMTLDEDGKETDENEVEDLQCFFSLTTKQGQIHVMEAISADEAQRLVVGIKNLAARLTQLLITGDKTVLSDFFDNTQEPEHIRVTEDEAMIRISHGLLDYLSRS